MGARVTTGDFERYRALCCHVRTVDVLLDASRVPFPDGFFDELRPRLTAAFGEMAALETGAVANPDEGRMVGHYWLRDPALAPDPLIAGQIGATIEAVRAFARDVHEGRVAPPGAPRFRRLLLVGIGGSALGPQLVADALAGPDDALRVRVLDNTDPDGIDRALAEIGDGLRETLLLVVSKSGGTPETRNGMLEAEAAYRARGLDPGRHAVAVTSDGSLLATHAAAHGWLTTFPMWDWVGGRTSVTSAVGLLPAALQGLDTAGLLDGARAMDAATRERDLHRNPAALLAAAWYHEGRGRGERAMVVLPYKDRLQLLSRYLQQLVMESLGKERDRQGNVVEQGIAVYGNKGSTDQHAYVQQLRDGRHDFFATFIDVLADRAGDSIEVADGATSGDYLTGFLLGTRQALAERGRSSVTITLRDVTARSLGALIALFERTVGLYAALVDINAYHQPGVEAGKQAAAGVLALQAALLGALQAAGGDALDAPTLAERVGAADRVDVVHTLLRHLAASGHHPVAADATDDVFDLRFRWTRQA
jgi:glucose-6-phosphate isomerase